MGNIHLDEPTIKAIIVSAVILIGALIVILVLNRAIRLMGKRLNMPLLGARAPRLVIRYSVLICAVALVLNEFKISDLGIVLKVIGTILGLVAIGFVATWSILSNFLCTFVLILFKPFAIGDQVEIPADSVTGKVVDITLMFTTLRSPAGEYINVPNNTFFQKIFKRRQGAEAIDLSHQLRQEKPAE